ncbi:MAG TPA: VWA domain-containing protein [Vicinamibacterales bacterium]|nr:VWA domain-containing protein [Vicinamibacterales bacterium]
MTRVAIVVALVAFAQVFRATTDVVTVDVFVQVGRQPLTGLTAADFIVRDNGVVQQVEILQAGAGGRQGEPRTGARLPLDVTMLLDVSGSVDGMLLKRLESAVQETAGALDPDDRIRLIQLSDQLNQVFEFQNAGAALSVGGHRGYGATSLYDGMIAAMIKPRAPERRHLIIAFTDGRDTMSFFDAATAEKLAQRADAVVHVAVGVAIASTPPPPRRPGVAMVGRGAVIVGNPGSMPPSVANLLRGRAALQSIVDATGGRILAIDLNQSIGEAFRALVDEFRTGYVLAYTPRGVKRGGWHEITVDVKRGKPEIRARKGYAGG